MPEPAREVIAQEFVLTDAAGNVQARLAATREGPTLTLYDAQGRRRAGLVVNGQGVYLSLVGDDGGKRLGLSVLQDHPSLDLFNKDGRLCLALTVAEGRSGLILVDEKHVPRAELEMTAGGPRLRLLDADGRVAFGAPDGAVTRRATGGGSPPTPPA